MVTSSLLVKKCDLILAKLLTYNLLQLKLFHSQNFHKHEAGVFCRLKPIGISAGCRNEIEICTRGF